jgi:hypothetical protein
MPRRKRDEAVEERASQILADKAERRRLSAQAAAGTRRQRRAQQQAETQDQAACPEQSRGEPKQTTRAKRERKERKPRVHADLLTVAFRGPLANHFREMAEQHEMSLARLLQDALLVCEKSIAAGYRPGATLEEWMAQREGDAGNA